jgi:hypothetical protein
VTQTVNVTVNPVNDAPRPTGANTSTLVLDEDTTAPFVIDFEDPEGDAILDPVLVTGPVHGSIGAGDIYIPNPDFNGSDSITYEVSDEFGATTQFTIDITVNPVNDDPVADATQDVTASEDDPVDITVVATDVDGDTLTYSVEAGDEPANGTVSGGGSDNGMFTYTPDADFSGDDSFVVTIIDHMGGMTTQTVNVTVEPDVNIIDIDIVGPNSTTPADVAGTDGPDVFTDDTTANTDVFITDFALGDFIQVTGAAEGDYNFGSGPTDPNDLYITFVNQTAGTSNLILIDDFFVLAPNSSPLIVETYQDAVDRLGSEFMTFA